MKLTFVQKSIVQLHQQIVPTRLSYYPRAALSQLALPVYAHLRAVSVVLQ